MAADLAEIEKRLWRSADQLRANSGLLPSQYSRPVLGLLFLRMREAGVSKAELARRLDWHPPQIDLFLDLCHASRLDRLEQSFECLGKRLAVDVQDAA